MGLFSHEKRSRIASIIPADLGARLPEIGWTVFHERVTGVDVSGFYLPGFLSAGSPLPGSGGWDAFTDQFLEELLAAASNAGGWGIAGAFYVAKDFVASEDHAKARFVEIVDRTRVHGGRRCVDRGHTHVRMGSLGGDPTVSAMIASRELVARSGGHLSDSAAELLATPTPHQLLLDAQVFRRRSVLRSHLFS